MGNPLTLLDVGKLSEPVTKLIEVVANGVGVLYEPTRIVNKAKAEKKADIIKTEGEIEIDAMKARAKRRLDHQEMQRQRNIEGITQMAIDALPESVSKDEVDPDWVTQFFNFAQDISNEEVQLIWAKLLANEVAQPGTYSLRTLNTIRLFSQKEAVLFSNICRYIWKISLYQRENEDPEETIGLITMGNDYLKNRLGLTTEDHLAHLQSLGLIYFPPTKHVMVWKNDWATLNYFGHKIHLAYKRPDQAKVYIGDNERSPSYGIISLSPLGMEIKGLCTSEPDMQYFRFALEEYKSNQVIPSEGRFSITEE